MPVFVNAIKASENERKKERIIANEEIRIEEKMNRKRKNQDE